MARTLGEHLQERKELRLDILVSTEEDPNSRPPNSRLFFKRLGSVRPNPEGRINKNGKAENKKLMAEFDCKAENIFPVYQPVI